MARKVCNYVYASDKATEKSAIYQRGQFYITDKTGKKDRYRYACMFIDRNGMKHLLGYSGQLTKARTFTNKMYAQFILVDTLAQLDFQKLAKKYLAKARPDQKPKQATIGKPKPKAKPKAAAEPKKLVSVLNPNKDDGNYLALVQRIETEKQKAKKKKKFTVADFNRVIAIQEEIRDNWNNDAQLSRENKFVMESMLVKNNLDLFPSRKIKKLSELKSKNKQLRMF